MKCYNENLYLNTPSKTIIQVFLRLVFRNKFKGLEINILRVNFFKQSNSVCTLYIILHFNAHVGVDTFLFIYLFIYLLKGVPVKMSGFVFTFCIFPTSFDACYSGLLPEILQAMLEWPKLGF